MTTEAKVLYAELKKLTTFVQGFLVLMDHTMKQPESQSRGKRVADLCNKLEFKNDSVKRFVLEVDGKGRKLKRPANISAE